MMTRVRAVAGFVLAIATIATFAASGPARAYGDDHDRGRDRRDTRRDFARIHREEQRLHDLYRRRDWCRSHRDWDALRDCNREIDWLQADIRANRVDVRIDIRDR